jgi:hypothetical protein
VAGAGSSADRGARTHGLTILWGRAGVQVHSVGFALAQ